MHLAATWIGQYCCISLVAGVLRSSSGCPSVMEGVGGSERVCEWVW